MNVRARLPDGLQQRLQRLAAAAQQARAVAGGHGQAAAALNQPRVLQGPGGRLGLLAAQRQPVVLRKQAGAVMPALEPLALHALRAKVGIHGQAHNGREAEHQNPRQRGHGRALLQHDPRSQRQRVGGPEPAKQGRPGNVCESGKRPGQDDRRLDGGAPVYFRTGMGVAGSMGTAATLFWGEPSISLSE